MKRTLIILFLSLIGLKTFCQNTEQPNFIRTSATFLRIAPDARSAALGETGAATTPDENSSYWNVAKTAFLTNYYGFALNYTPWLSNLKAKVNSYYLTGYKTMDNGQTLSLNFNYLSIGRTNLTDEIGNDLGSYNPNEFSLELGFAKQFGEDLSLGMTAKYIRSDLTQRTEQDGATTSAGNALAVDFGFYYKKTFFNSNTLSFGVVLSNIGTKLNYSTSSSPTNFLPMNLRAGTAYHIETNSDVMFNLSFDINKLLVPTPPIYNLDANGQPTEGIIAGSDPDVSVPNAIFKSFGDAPGGAKEELQEISLHLGAECLLGNKFALRTGLVHESKFKGFRRYATAGIGYVTPAFSFNLAYIIPTDGQANPYANTFRIGLAMSIN